MHAVGLISVAQSAWLCTRLYDKNKRMAYEKNKETDLKEVEPGVVGECFADVWRRKYGF
jgi:hypothetical protein